MDWIRKKFKGNKIYARVDDEGELIVEAGRAEIKYSKKDNDRVYRAAAWRVVAVDAPDPESEHPAQQNGGSALRPERPDRNWSSAPQPEARKRYLGKAPAAGTESKNALLDGAIQIYTDGACSGNPGPAGIGALLIYGDHLKEISEHIGNATNNVAELTAILRALQTIKTPDKPIALFTDSQYAIGVLTKGWKAKANQELIAEVKAELNRFTNLNFHYVRGHVGTPENERADELACRGRDRMS